MTQPPSYAETLAENRRLAILRLLIEINGGGNDSSIHQGLEMLGFRRESRTTVRDDLNFLSRNGLVKESWHNDLMIVDITARGVEAAEGRISVAGVKKPSLGL